MTKAKRVSTLQRDNAASAVAQDSCEALRKAGFPESETERFVAQIVGILDDYAAAFGEGTEVEYAFRRRLVKLDVLIAIPGEAFDPFTDGSGAKQRAVDRIFDLNRDAGSSGIIYRYSLKRNIICVSIPLGERPTPEPYSHSGSPRARNLRHKSQNGVLARRLSVRRHRKTPPGLSKGPGGIRRSV